jgi:ABC-type glycerol-3-phosphate transport system substrate-binding protein
MKLRKAIAVLMMSIIGMAAFATGQGEETTAMQAETVRLLIGSAEDVGSDDPMVVDYLEEQVLNTYDLAFDLAIKRTSAGSTFDQSLNLSLASGDIDAWVHPLSEEQFGDPTLLADLSDAIEEYGSNIQRVNAEFFSATGVDRLALATDSEGRVKYLPNYNSGQVDKVFWARKDLFEELGMEFRQDMTLSHFEEFLSRVSEQYPDLIPLGRTAKVPHMLDKSLFGLGVPEDQINDEGLPVPYIGTGLKVRYPFTDGYMTKLEMLNRWYENGYVPEEFLTWARQRAIEMVEQGEVAAAVSSWWRRGLFDQLRREKGIDFRMLVMTEEDGSPITILNPHVAGGLPRSVNVLQSSQDLAKYLVALFDWGVADIDHTIVFANGIQGVHWEYNDEGTKIVPVEYDDWDAFGEAEVYSGLMHIYLTRGPFQGEIQRLVSQSDDDSWLATFDTQLHGTQVPDLAARYGELDDMIRERGIAFDVGDWATFIEEIEVSVMIGDRTPQEGVDAIRDFMETNDYQEWWDARMEIFKESGVDPIDFD